MAVTAPDVQYGRISNQVEQELPFTGQKARQDDEISKRIVRVPVETGARKAPLNCADTALKQSGSARQVSNIKLGLYHRTINDLTTAWGKTRGQTDLSTISVR